MLELDLVISKYVTKHIDQWSDQQCNQFHNQILTKETPDLYKLIISKELIQDQMEPFVKDLIEFTKNP